MAVTSAASPRPGGIPLTRLHQLIDWRAAESTMGSIEGADRLRRAVEGFAADLDGIGYSGLRTCMVHGDPTTFNVLADGSPLQPGGLIDFELADVESPVADIAFCLWRSGRPAQDAKELDLTKVRQLVAGYRSVRPLTEQELAAIPICLRGRGLQMLAKRTQHAIRDDGPLAELLWLEAHQRELANAINA
jgi:homoserine kinase type II